MLPEIRYARKERTCGHVESTASATAVSKESDSGGVKSPTAGFNTRISGAEHDGLLQL